MPDVTFLFPCLNEERTLVCCVAQVRASLDKAALNYEIVVADNGSTDRSREIAQEQGCRVVPVPERGYGAALRGGIMAARSRYVMFADSDDTYLYSDAAALYKAARDHDADMAIASRMNGKIEPGAMPWMHRWLGTPVLTWLINRLFQGQLSDCNSGFRCLKREAFERWDVRANGMEFASELLIKALKAGASIVEIKSGLRCGPPDRVAHLRTWRDGMRHLLFILSEKPRLFELTGLVAALAASFLQTLAAVVGPVGIAGTFHVFDIHSQALLLLAAAVGAQFYVFSCMLYLQSRDRPLRMTRKLIEMDEGVLFFLLVVLNLGVVAVVGVIGAEWALSRFGNLNVANRLLASVHLLVVAQIFAIGLLGVHVLKKARR